MRFLLGLLITVYATTVACTDTTKRKDSAQIEMDYDNEAMWKKLFTQLNTMSSEIEKLSQGQAYLNQRFDELSKRLEDHDKRPPKSTEKEQEIRGDLSKRRNELIENVQDIKGILNQSQAALLENLREFRGDFNRRQEDLIDNVQMLKKRQDAQYGLGKRRFRYERVSASESILSCQYCDVPKNKTWAEYKKGFSVNGFSFMGLERLYYLTTYESTRELMIIFTDVYDQKRYAKYDLFQIGSEDEKYALKNVGAYIGNAGDFLLPHLGHKFSTYDLDNDDNDEMNCASIKGAGWWFSGNCDVSLFNNSWKSIQVTLL